MGLTLISNIIMIISSSSGLLHGSREKEKVFPSICEFETCFSSEYSTYMGYVSGSLSK